MSNSDTSYLVVTETRGGYCRATDIIYQCTDKDEAICVCADYAYAQCDKAVNLGSPYATSCPRIGYSDTTNVCSIFVSVPGADTKHYEVREIVKATGRNRKQPWK